MVKRQIKVVEAVYDDCGEDLSSIVKNVDAYLADSDSSDDEVTQEELDTCHNINLLVLMGPEPQKPAASSRSLAHIEMRGSTSLASPIRVAPFTAMSMMPGLSSLNTTRRCNSDVEL